jgi:hypothetical protein
VCICVVAGVRNAQLVAPPLSAVLYSLLLLLLLLCAFVCPLLDPSDM